MSKLHSCSLFLHILAFGKETWDKLRTHTSKTPIVYDLLKRILVSFSLVGFAYQELCHSHSEECYVSL